MKAYPTGRASINALTNDGVDVASAAEFSFVTNGVLGENISAICSILKFQGARSIDLPRHILLAVHRTNGGVNLTFYLGAEPKPGCPPDVVGKNRNNRTRLV